MKYLAKNLTYLIRSHLITQTALARATGVPQPSLNRMISGTTKEPRYANLQAIADYFSVSVDDLRNTDLSAKSSKNIIDINVSTPAYHGVKPIPVISAVQAGALTEATDPYAVGSGHDVIYTSTETSKWAFALDIKGESMLPEFQPGDKVIIDPEVQPQPGDYVVAKNHKEEATFKKYRPVTYDESGNLIFELTPLNPDFASLRSDVSHLQVIGVMVEHRKYRKRH